MKIETVTITEALRISDLAEHGLDAITVSFQDIAPGQGRIWLECYGNAWAAWWGAMGNCSVRAFVADSDPDYLAKNLSWGRMQRGSKQSDAYLKKICEVVISALKAA